MYLVFDLDGTLIFEGEPLSIALCHALVELEKLDTQIIFATARPLRDTLPILPKRFHEHTIIGCNGAMISQGGNVVSASTFEEQHIETLLNWLDAKDITYLFDSYMNYAVSNKPHYFHQIMTKYGHLPTDKQILQTQPIVKLLVLESHCKSQLTQFCETNLFKFAYYHHSGHDCFDVVPNACNKLQALQKLKIDLNNTLCFGNDINDLAMLNAAKKAFVVGNKVTPSREYIQLEQHTLLASLKNLALSLSSK
ncbi:HAD-IIB family hydrolase [Pseudoalteromonas sp. NEC-BIFX-2020_015]|uniref:HAD-IIB family hydrolase n=1 Tax=Pseudoalteromonas sp. NEC-BIFX-2020_015 TaxID=2729544 RepID=UPI00146130E0|nr:HAD-IIB family hydrolase [Pseudoalteromonas sp. NEC-BIFX-2020_015]NMR26897.1 HAD-IIB family hydrolase [Pseudoalteromonas sp. NEC-BIFX-2020_015]